MDNSIYNDLSSGAKALLESYIEDYQNKLLVSIADKAIEENRKISEFTAKDIFEIHQFFGKDAKKQKDSKYRLLSLLSIVGLLYALIGSMLILMMDGMYTVYLVIIITGCVTSLLGIIYSTLDAFKGREVHKKRDIQNDYLLSEINEIWETIQKISVTKNIDITGKGNSNIQAITWLMHADYLSQSDKVNLKGIINARNAAVHEDITEALPRSKLREIIHNGRDIIQKLSALS